jgi:hypothetical protein
MCILWRYRLILFYVLKFINKSIFHALAWSLDIYPKGTSYYSRRCQIQVKTHACHGLFLTCENKQQSVLRISFPKCRNRNTICEYLKAQSEKCIIITIHTWTAVFLRLLANICPSWPRSGLRLSPILASPSEHASCCHAHPSILLFIATVQVWPQRLLLSGWLLTNVQVNITTMLHDTWHTCIYSIRGWTWPV